MASVLKTGEIQFDDGRILFNDTVITGKDYIELAQLLPKLVAVIGRAGLVGFPFGYGGGGGPGAPGVPGPQGLQGVPGGGGTLDDAYDFGGLGAGRTIIADAGSVQVMKTSVDANDGFEVDVTAGTGRNALFTRSVAGVSVRSEVPAAGDTVWESGLTTPTTTILMTGGGRAVFGGSAFFAAEQVRIVGDARVEGKLTVTGAIDPTSVLLSGGTALFYESNDGVTAPVSGAATGRIRYNDAGTGNWQVSMQGSPYANLGTGTVGPATAPQVAFFTSATTVGGDAGMTYDAPNDALTVGVARIHSTGTRNTFTGQGAGNFTLTGTDDSGFGHNALALSTSGSLNSAFGSASLAANTTGFRNSAFGKNSLTANTTGASNCAFGRDALLTNVTGSSNSAFGASALSMSTVTGNSAFGTNALLLTTTGADNCAFGSSALSSNTTAAENSAFGSVALGSNSTGTRNCAFGRSALNVSTTADDNSAFGHNTLLLNMTGTRNCAYGSATLSSSLTANDVSAFGHNALLLSTGANNSAFGSTAGDAITTGTGNSCFGQNSLGAATTGIDSVAVGRDAGLALTTGGTCTFIGATADTTLATAANSTAIGFGARVAASNTMVFGNASVTSMLPGSDAGAALGSATVRFTTFNASSEVNIFAAPADANPTSRLASGQLLIGVGGATAPTKVVGAQGAAVADAAGGVVVDIEARAALNGLLARVRAATGHGLIA